MAHPLLGTPTPMQRLFTNEEIGLILKYKLQWKRVEQVKRVIESIRKTEPTW